MIKNPSLPLEEKLGVEMGVIRGENFLCEDSGLFDIPLSYSVVAKSPEVIVYRIKSLEMQALWPRECITEMKILVLEKYKWFYDRLLQLEIQLSKNEHNSFLLQGAREVE